MQREDAYIYAQSDKGVAAAAPNWRCAAAGLEIEWADDADVVPVPTPLQPTRPTLCGDARVCCNVGHG